MVTWTVTDTSGNTNTCQQQVIVLDSQAPTIAWHMTNVVVAAGTNCQALMPDITGTNYILAADNCSSVTVTQSVATNTVLSLGTNEVVLGAFDAAGNVAYCTNYVLVVDQTPPSITCPADVTVSSGRRHMRGDECGFGQSGGGRQLRSGRGDQRRRWRAIPVGTNAGDLDGDGYQRQQQQLPAAGDRAGQPALRQLRGP